jgi:hypothetical protein
MGERETRNIPRMSDVVLSDLGDGVFTGQMPHNSFPKVMKAVDYQLIRTEYGTYLALSNEHTNKTIGFWKSIRHAAAAVIAFPITGFTYLF